MEKKICHIWSVCLYLIFIVILGCGCSIHNIRKGDSKTTFPDSQLKIMTFNIRVGCGRDNFGVSPYRCTPKKKNLNLVAMAIKSEGPDVVALQEVKGFYQAKYIAETLNMNFAYSTHSSNHPWWGMAILSKFEILNSKTRNIHYGDDERSSLICEIKIDDSSYHFVNVHYHLGDYKSQVSSTMRIANRIQGPVVLLGDFNRKTWDPVLETVQDKFIDTCTAVSTESSKYVEAVGTGFGRIDYIFVQDRFIAVLDAGIASLEKYRNASDHYAYYSILKIKN